jgi:hypothetical protein
LTGSLGLKNPAENLGLHSEVAWQLSTGASKAARERGETVGACAAARVRASADEGDECVPLHRRMLDARERYGPEVEERGIEG